MITRNNYFEKVSSLNLSKYPEAIQKGHTFFEKSNRFYGKSEQITKTIDLYLKKLNEALAEAEKEEEDDETAPLKMSDIPAIVKKVMPKSQLNSIIGYGEHKAVVKRLEKEIKEVPELRENEEGLIYLHYFKGGSDWWITEWDREEGLFFGFVVLNGDETNAEWGYSSVEELVNSRIELDFFWKKQRVKDLHNGIFNYDKEEEEEEEEEEKKPEPEPTKKPVEPKKEAKKTATKAKAKPAKKPVAKDRKPTKKAVKAKKPAKVKIVMKEAPKAPVQVKKYSLEMQLLRSFSGLNGRTKSVKALEALHKKISDATQAKQIHDYQKEIADIEEKLAKAIDMAKKKQADDITIEIEESFFTKVKALIKNASERLRISFLAGVEKKKPRKVIKKRTGRAKQGLLGTPTFVPDSPVISINTTADPKALENTEPEPEMPTLAGFVRADQGDLIPKQDVFRLDGPMGEFLQDLQRFRLAITLRGNRGAGKTTFLTKLLNAFLGAGMNAAFFSLEQGGLESKDTKNLIDANITPENKRRLQVAGEAQSLDSITKYASQFDVIAVDSWQKLNLPNTAFDQLRTKYPNTIWIIIFQENAQRGMRGGVAAEFDAPVVLRAERVDNSFVNNYVVPDKNRGNKIDLKYIIASDEVKPLYQEEQENNIAGVSPSGSQQQPEMTEEEQQQVLQDLALLRKQW